VAASQKAICVETENGIDLGGCEDPAKRDLRGAGLRKAAVLFYAAFVWVYAVILAINVGFAKDGRGYWFKEGEEGAAEGEAEGEAEGAAEGEGSAEG